jgi:hypothetical protein
LQPPGASAVEPGELPAERKITAQDASTIEFFVETLKTQPAFPPMIIEYQAAWYNPGDDARPLESSVANTLLSSRLLLSHGLHGLNYFPLQDSFTPAGYSTPWTNRHYRWDAALDPSAGRQFRARAVERNGDLMEMWGEFLAASHKRADFGLIYPLGSFPQEPLAREDIARVSGGVLRVARLAALAGLSCELLDPQFQPAEQLLRHPVVLLPAFEKPAGQPGADSFLLSARAQRAIVEYVERGGTLVVFPALPSGEVIDRLFAREVSRPAEPAADGTQQSAIGRRFEHGKGRVFESSKDFFSWVMLNESLSENRARFEAAWARQVLREFMHVAGVRPAVVFKEGPQAAQSELMVTQLVSNRGTGLLGERTEGRGLLSVTNLSYDAPVEQALDILSPRAGALGSGEADILPLTVNLPPRESLLLPVHASLCLVPSKGGETCSDEVTLAGAELLRAERDGKTLELTFYVPARAQVVLTLARAPGRVQLDENRLESKWDPQTKRLTFEVPRGASPQFRRGVRIGLPYTPAVPERPDPSKNRRIEVIPAVLDAVRLPLGTEASLASDPPLVVLDSNGEGRILVQGTNLDQFGADLDIKVTGPVRGSDWISMDGGEARQKVVKLSRTGGPAGQGGGMLKDSQGLLRGEIEFRSGKMRKAVPIFFAVLNADVVRYQYDLDRDGAQEWVLESSDLRLIVSPEAGGSAVALVNKSDGTSLFTSAGGLRDNFAFTPNAPNVRPERARGRYGMFNRAYRAAWDSVEGSPALRMEYAALDVYPAGASIRKTVSLGKGDSLAVDYEVTLAPAKQADGPAPAAAQDGPPAQSFVSVHSIPVVHDPSGSTQFCFGGDAADAEQKNAGSSPAAQSEPRRCESFAPNGPALNLPANARSLSIETPARSTLKLEWPVGRMSVEMKNYSALLKLEFPPLQPGGESGRYSLRFSVLPGK